MGWEPETGWGKEERRTKPTGRVVRRTQGRTLACEKMEAIWDALRYSGSKRCQGPKGKPEWEQVWENRQIQPWEVEFEG